MKHLTWGRWHMWGNCAWGGWYEVGFISFLMFIACNGTDVWLMDEKMFGCRAITNLSFSLKDSGTFSALKKTSDRTSIALVSLTFAAYTWDLQETHATWLPSLVVLPYPAAIHLVGIAGKMKKKIEKYKLLTWSVHVLCLCRKVCLDWRHKRGRRSQHSKQLNLFFFKHIICDK